jgi:serine/threonine protein kinase HipA of HipAB toxin-antitoxin module
MTRQTDTDWITEGGRVVVYTFGHRGESARFDTVDRLTNTQIVLVNTEGRFRRETLEPVARRGTWDTERTVLLRPDDERVVHLRVRTSLGRLAKKAAEAAQSASGEPVQALAKLDLIEGFIRSARATIEGAALSETTKD